MVTESDLGERLRRMPPGSVVALRLDPARYADHYLLAINATVRDVGIETNARSIYVSVTNPSALVWSIAQTLDVPPERLRIVDAISHIMMDYRNPLPNATYLESPRMLENIMLRVEYLLRKEPGQRHIVVIDSVNSLAIHNPAKLLNEFLHILLSNLKSRQVLTVLLAVRDDSSPAIDQLLALVVDETIDLGEGVAPP